LLLNQREIDITKTVVDRFLNLGEPTLRGPLLVRAQSIDLLRKLARWSILNPRDDDREFLPLAFAFHCCADTATAALARHSLTVVAHVLKNLFENNPSETTQHTSGEVESHAKVMYHPVDPNQIGFGLYLAQEFRLVTNWFGGQRPTAADSFQISEHIVEIDPEKVWADYVERQTEWIEGQAGILRPTTSRLADEGTSTGHSPTETTETYAGWEILRALSKNTGQSEVFLVRSPQRVAERTEASKTIQGYASGVNLEQTPAFATAIWLSARADLPSELGALKVFKLRGDGAEAEQEVLDRLSSEIHVLKQNKPGLLRLLPLTKRKDGSSLSTNRMAPSRIIPFDLRATPLMH
jgi:hypothetical protein